MVYMAQSSIRFEISELNVSKSGWTTLFVDGSYTAASDANDGYSWEHPKKTISGALAAANPWCKIYVKSTEYPESVTIPYEHVQLIGMTEDGPSVAKIVATGGTGIIITAGFCEIMNMAVEATNLHAIQATLPGHHFHNLAISLVNTSGAAKYGIWLNDADKCEIDNCHIDGNGNDEVIGIFAGDDCVDVNIHDNYIEGFGDGTGDAGCVAGVCTNNGYCIGIAESAQRVRVHDNVCIDGCVGVYFYKTGGEAYKGHSIIHNQFYELCNYDIFDQFDPDDETDASGILIRENFYGYSGGWFEDSNRDGRADYMVECGTNKDYAPLASPQAWRTSPIARSNNI